MNKGRISAKINSACILDVLLFMTLLLLILLIGFACFYVEYPEGDPKEHIYSTYMVSQGYVPYVDFFEHHHPLLWYVAQPLVLFLNRNIEILGWANYCTFCFFLWGLYFVYRIITEFLSTRVAALLSLIYILLPKIFLYYIYFKPDNWMITCIAGGVYYFFLYLRDKMRKDLVISYLFFFVAFLFLQKAVLYFPAVGFFSLYYLYKKEIKKSDFLWALLLPLCLAGCVTGYFWYHHGLKEYFYLNFLFNSQMMDMFGEKVVSKPKVLVEKIVVGTALFVSLLGYKFANRYFRFYCWLFWVLLFHRAVYFSPYLYYWYEPYYWGIPLVVSTLMILVNKQKALLWIVGLETLIYAGFMGSYIYSDVMYKPKILKADYSDLVMTKSNECDTFVGYNQAAISMFNRVPLYYWFLQGELDVFGEKMGFHPVENLSEIIEREKPKYIVLTNIYERYHENKEKKRIVHEPDMNIIEKYYEPTRYASDKGKFDFETFSEVEYDYKHGLWKLKEEYQKKNCRYNKNIGRWMYVD